MPIGNLTSQIFANIYLNELDQFVKQRLRIKYYFRYADDFVVVNNDTKYLLDIKNQMENFLLQDLNLSLHPNKVEIRKFTRGVDFLGYVILPHHVVLRTKTKKRLFSKLYQKQELFHDGLLDGYSYSQSVQSYLGMLQHCDSYDITSVVKNNFLR